MTDREAASSHSAIRGIGSEAVRIAHLSDLHLPNVAGFTPRFWNVKRALGWLNWQIKRRVVHKMDAADAILADILAQAPDHVAITGDLVNIGLPFEYEAALRFLQRVGPPDRVSVVPGNHDIYVDPEGAAGTALWRAYMMPESVPAPPIEAAPGQGAPWYVDAFPFVRRVGCVALIGLNSSRPTAIGYAGGAVGAEQLARLEAVLSATRESGLARVVLIHHPPLRGLAASRRAIDDVAAVEEAIGRHGAELVLHGHNHEVSDREIGTACVMGIASGSAAYPYKHEPRACWRLIHISRDGAGFRISTELRGFAEYGDEIGRIVEPRTSSA